MQDRGTATLMARRSRRNLGTSTAAGLLLILKGLRREGLGLGVGNVWAQHDERVVRQR